MSRPPIVTDIDRKWALDQCPPWATLHGDVAEMDDEPGEIIDETDEERAYRLKRKAEPQFNWSWFVDGQITRFEREFRDERRSYSEWSKLWRKAWWPKSDPFLRMPKAMAKKVPFVPHPFVKRGDPLWSLALNACTPAERKVCEKIGVVMFKLDDPRAKILQPKVLTETSKRMMGEGK